MPAMLNILAEHLQEIEFLWAQRVDAIHSVDYRHEDIRQLDDRIDSHLQGLLLGGQDCVQLAEPRLVEEDRFVAFSGAWCLARLGFFDPILDALDQCNLNSVADALCHCSIDAVAAQFQQKYRDSDPVVASAIGLVLATHQLTPNPNRLSEFFKHEDPLVRRRAWKTVSRSCNA